MSHMTNERVFGAALSNEYQWRNLYFKQFGCCTYAPPMPKDPSTTAEGVYPLRRQMALLNQPFSESDSDGYAETDDEQRTSLSPMTPDITVKDTSFESVSHTGSSSVQGRGTIGDQFFQLDLSSAPSSLTPQQQQQQRGGCGGASKRANGGRRGNRGAALRKDDFFDVSDAFSTKFFGFLWQQDDDDDATAADDEEEAGEDGDQKTNTDSLGGSGGGTSFTQQQQQQRQQQQRRPAQSSPHGSTLDSTVRDPHNSSCSSHRLTISRNAFFTSIAGSDFNDNPHGVHAAMLRLHHETWMMLMDNRLMAWLHQQTVDHCQSATQLRQRLLDVVARGPSIVAASSAVGSSGANTQTQRRTAGAAPPASTPSSSSYAPTRTQEEALQSTLESFSPFFVVIAPAAAVQRAKDQFQAARRAQLHDDGGRPARTAPADIVGLPLYSQYGSWREAYEHRQRWDKTPFSFFLLHDCSYNSAQVTAIYVQLHLLYVHAHSHTRLCAEVKPESVSLQDGSAHLACVRNISRAVEFQRSMCPLTVMQEVTESIVLAYEQSSSRATLTMLRRVLDFLTDIALDVVTAYRFISREALLRQSGSDLPGMEGQHNTRAVNTEAEVQKRPQHDNAEGDGAAEAAAAAETEAAAASAGQTADKTTPVTTPVAFLEPQRVTESDVNDLFELVYWFVDAATANAGVPADPETLRPSAAAATTTDIDSSDAALQSAAASNRSNAPPPSSLANAGYLPGKELVYKPVGSFVEAVELLEAHRKPLWMQHLTRARGQSVSQNKKVHVVVSAHDELQRASFTAATAATASPLLSADSFTGLATPLVLLTTYLRLHGGQWLKKLCSRVFGTLRKQSVVLYVNTADMDAIWSRLQDASTSTKKRLGSAMTTSTNTTGRAGADSSSPLPPANVAGGMEAARRTFMDGVGRLEEVICQDILYAVTEFCEALYGLRAAARLPHGISVLLTQFVTTVNLFLLDAGGGTTGGVVSAGDTVSPGSPLGGGNADGAGGGGYMHNNNNNNSDNGIGRPMMGGKEPTSFSDPRISPGVETSSSRVRRVEERLQVCKQRYYAGLRRCLLNSAEAHRSAVAKGSRQAQQIAEQASPAAAATSLRRLLQTIEHHRLAKFILFDCWILPALNNAVSFGYLAPDSSLHLRWNIDALARYLKVLLHAPFVEQDRATFASLAGQQAQNASNNKAGDGDGGGGDGGDGKQSSGNNSNKAASLRLSRRKSNKLPDKRAQPTNVLTLPPYLTGIYDVATGSLVRLQPATAFGSKTTAAAETSPRSFSRGLVAGKTPKPAFKPNWPSPDSITLAGGAQSPAVLSEGDVNETSSLNAASKAWGRPKQSFLFESLPTATAPDIAMSGLSVDPSSSVGGTGKWRTALRGDPAFAPAEKLVLPPVTSTVEAAGSGGDNRDGRNAASNKRKSMQTTTTTSSSAAAEASQSSSLARGRMRRQLSVSSTFIGATADAAPPASVAANVQHPYVYVNTASWLDMSPAMQFLNEQLGLTCADPDGDELVFSDLSATEDCRGSALGVGRGAAGAGAGAAEPRLPSMEEDNSFTFSATRRAPLEDLPAVQALNAFCRAAAADESENVVVSEFDVLPTMAAGCIEKLYDIVTGAHPMVARALQTGAFNFTRSCGSAPLTADFTSLYSACLNGVLLHPHTAAQVMRNVFENSPAFGYALMKPVAEGTALELLNSLVAGQGETPMVDANAVVPLLQMSTADRTPTSGNGGNAINTAALTRRWESESRRLLRQFAFLTTGFADTQRPFPLVPGLHRPVGPAHPIHVIRAGANRIAADMGGGGGAVPLVFDPWWRAMVVALSVKASNMFDECREEHAAAFLKKVHDSEEASKLLNRQSTVQFIVSEGKETEVKASEETHAKRASTTAARRARTGVAAAAASRHAGETRRHKSGTAIRTKQPRKKVAVKRSYKAGSAASVTNAAGN